MTHSFILLLGGVSTGTMLVTSSSSSSSSSEPNDDGTRTRKRKRKQKTHQERSFQILAGHPGIMELIGRGLCWFTIRGKECRMLKKLNELVIEYLKIRMKVVVTMTMTMTMTMLKIINNPLQSII